MFSRESVPPFDVAKAVRTFGLPHREEKIQQLFGTEASPFPAYVIETQIGEGTTGKVYRALSTKNNVVVAVKTWKQTDPFDIEQPTQQTKRRRLMNEGQVLKELDHINIVKPVGFESIDGQLHLVMEYLAPEDYTPLDVLIKQRRFSPQECVPILEGIKNALVHCWERGVIHRDVKPANVLAGSTVKLIDFGFSNKVITNPDAVTGTFDYASHEMLTGQEMTEASDVTSLGTIVFEMMTGKIPLHHPEWTQRILLNSNSSHRYVILEEIQTTLNAYVDAPETTIEKLTTIFERVFSRDQAMRYENLQDFYEDFSNTVLVSTAISQTEPANPPEEIVPSKRSLIAQLINRLKNL